jgi:hypothetical protein
MSRILRLTLFILVITNQLHAQQSVARLWNEQLLQAIRLDFARPPVHARNLFHLSVAMYDAWAAYDTVARPYLLGDTVAGYICPFNGVPAPANLQSAREEAISFAAYRVLVSRFANSPNAATTIANLTIQMLNLGYNYTNTSTDYSSGSPAALGNYIGQSVIQMGYFDGSNELNNYINQFYHPVNPPLVMAHPGNPTQLDPNRWQPLQLTTAIDQNGNPIGSTQVFQSPEWGRVVPFALKESELTIYERENQEWYVYNDPGTPPMLDTMSGAGDSEEFKWNYELVSVWGAHHDPNDGVMWDISPASIGNVSSYPNTLAGLRDFYDLENGGDTGHGRALNPKTGQPYPPQIVPRGDYTRVLAQFWADGPNSETPPGHWFSIMNKVIDHPDFVRKFNGKGPVLEPLEWDVKAYFTLGGAVHDAAVCAWGIKGWYDHTRPVAALRYMAELGQSSDPALPNYHPAGLELIPGFVEQVTDQDPLAGPNNQNVGKIKLYTWRGPNYVTDPSSQIAGVGWVLAEEWWPYQRKTFVTPPFAGYISGHSTYSRSAAEALTLLTGDEFFPGGMGEFHIAANSNFLGLEKGPSVDVTLQWATYRDASDQTSLSRIWGGIHPPFDDIPGRFIGAKAGIGAFNKAKTYFYKDVDGDGYYAFEDCNDNDPAIHPGATELCDGIDSDCDGLADDNALLLSFFADTDGDGYGNAAIRIDTCTLSAPAGFVTNNQDCDDARANVYPGAPELCDQIDNNCDGATDEGFELFAYFPDADGDGYGVDLDTLRTCAEQAPAGYAAQAGDCNDQNAAVYPGAAEICDHLDNNCNGNIDDGLPLFTYYQDNDGDFYGTNAAFVQTCSNQIPNGYTGILGDCDDNDFNIFPAATEKCDGIDNNCNGSIDENLPQFVYYPDGDGDGYGTEAGALSTCQSTAPGGFVLNSLDCNDAQATVYPGADEVNDGLDNDCDGLVDETSATNEPGVRISLFPNPATESVQMMLNQAGDYLLTLRDASGKIQIQQNRFAAGNSILLSVRDLAPGIYWIDLYHQQSQQHGSAKLIVL